MVQILHSLLTQFAELDRYEASCEQSLQDARSSFRHSLSSYAARFPREFSNPHAASPNASILNRLTLPPLPNPPIERHERQLPTSSYHPSPLAAPSSHANGVPATSHTTYKQPASSQSFHSLPLPPPPVASGLSAYASSSVIPTKRSHRSNSEREDDPNIYGINGQSSRIPGQDWEEQKRRKMGQWDRDTDSVRHLAYSYTKRLT